METIIDIGEPLLKELQERAAEQGLTLHEVVEAALQHDLHGQPVRAGYQLRWTPERGRLLPGVNLDRRRTLFDLMDGRR